MEEVAVLGRGTVCGRGGNKGSGSSTEERDSRGVGKRAV